MALRARTVSGTFEKRAPGLFASVLTTTVFREVAEQNAYFAEKLQSPMITGVIGSLVCDKQQLWEGGLQAPSDRVTRTKAEGNGRGGQE